MSSGTLTANEFSGGESTGNLRGSVTFAGITSLLLGIAEVVTTRRPRLFLWSCSAGC